VRGNEPPPADRACRLRWLLLACVVLPFALQAADDQPRTKFGLDQRAALELSRSTIGHVPGDYVLRDRKGREVALHSYRGKPLLVNFIYTSCFQICPNGSRSLFAAVRAMRERFGPDQFNVVSIGFNQPEDSPQALAVFATQQRINDRNWELLSPRAEDVAALAADFGFSFAATPAGFDHTLQVTILDRDGRVYRQVYGDGFAADSLGEPIKQLIAGTLVSDTGSWSDLIDRVRILCSVYDPVTGTYRTDYKLYIEIAGGVTFALAGFLFAIGEWRNRRRMRRVTAAAAP
jgi:protein SCO1